MQQFLVRVWADDGDRSKVYKVISSTKEDAMQLAFALDGGWGTLDAREILPLAQNYCEIVNLDLDK